MLVFTHVYRQAMNEATVWAYREVLKDLTPPQLDRGCIGAMKRTKFTPTPSEILDYAIEQSPSIFESSTEAPMTQEEAKEFLNKVRGDIPWIKEKAPDYVLEVSDEVRARYEKNKSEALRKCEKCEGKSA